MTNLFLLPLCRRYGGETAAADTTWAARQQLLRQQLLRPTHAPAGGEYAPHVLSDTAQPADIIALQETSELSFNDDWAFLLDAGYDFVVLKCVCMPQPCCCSVCLSVWTLISYPIWPSLHAPRSVHAILGNPWTAAHWVVGSSILSCSR